MSGKIVRVAYNLPAHIKLKPLPRVGGVGVGVPEDVNANKAPTQYTETRKTTQNNHACEGLK